MNQYALNMYRICVAYPQVHVGNPDANVNAILDCIPKESIDVLVLPELCITGYTCGDLFAQSKLIQETENALQKLAHALADHHKVKLAFVGAPIIHNDALYNCAVALEFGKIVGIVPKVYLPNYKEFYEKRWFASGEKFKNPVTINKFGGTLFGTDLLFVDRDQQLKVGVEICEDVWTPVPPSSFHALRGANLLVNLSASNETVAKCEYRRQMIEQQSARCIAAYAYCSSGPTESTSDLVFGGHCIIAENGSTLVETKRFADQDYLIADIDVERLTNERRRSPTFWDSQSFLVPTMNPANEITGKVGGSVINNSIGYEKNSLNRKINPFPFVPQDQRTLLTRCDEIFNIQVCGLSKRLKQIGPNGRYTIGISGGLDSTLAALVAYKACQRLGWDTKVIDAITLPGFGTSKKTFNNSLALMKLLGFRATEIDIRPLCLQAFRDINHKPFGLTINPDETIESFQSRLISEVPAGAKDDVFENTQARIRTFILMSRGFVIGTGDLSELALGWCTYNGDHMSMYSVNCSIPKTLVKFLVKYVADNVVSQADTTLKTTLLSIVDTKISPELLPLDQNGNIVHNTEDAIGPYELHDFFLFNFIRNNFNPYKIYVLACHAFDGRYISNEMMNGKHTPESIKKWLVIFLKRFFTNQFKRNCVPDGPKVGSVSLSPRGDWRMPSDAEVKLWLKDLV